jgi:uncharacterized protein (DUF305 family)
MRCPRSLTAVTAALALAVAGCSDPADGSREGYNAADVDFAGDMIQHHAQALEMVDATLGRDLDTEVAELTEEIRAAQAPEIETMADWLVDWDQPVPATSRDHANAHGDGGDIDMDMPGMMSADDMAALENVSDAEFQDTWLTMMVEHHEGAVEMAEEQLESGESAEAVALAEEIVRAQEREIAEMQELLGR